MGISSRYNNIVLIGFMGCGKSSVGRELANILEMGFVDSDEVIEDRYGSISEIFRIYGEGYFREIEKSIVSRLEGCKNKVIATGGGMSIYNDVKPLGVVVYLDARLEDIKSRVGIDKNRVLFDERVEQLFASREARYRESADLIVECNGGIAEVANRIKERLEAFLDYSSSSSSCL